VLKSYLLNYLHCKELGLQDHRERLAPDSQQSRRRAGNSFSGPAPKSAEQIIRDVPDGLYVTGSSASAVNWSPETSLAAPPAYGSGMEAGISRGRNHRRGKLEGYAEHIARSQHLEWRSSVACPTLRIEGMTVAGVSQPTTASTRRTLRDEYSQFS